MEVDADAGMLRCMHTVKDLHSKFKHFEKTQINEALVELNSEGLVKTKLSGEIILGVTDKGIHKLIGSKQDSTIEDYTKMLHDAAQSFMDVASGEALVTAKNNLKDFEKLHCKPITNWTYFEFVDLFNISYISVYQQPFRILTGKERGQIKNMVNAHKASSLYKMIIYYVFHSERYGKSLSPGIFQYNQDRIYETVTEKAKVRAKSEKQRTRTAEDDEQSFI
jgi:hypothetical protein